MKKDDSCEQRIDNLSDDKLKVVNEFDPSFESNNTLGTQIETPNNHQNINFINNSTFKEEGSEIISNTNNLNNPNKLETKKRFPAKHLKNTSDHGISTKPKMTNLNFGTGISTDINDNKFDNKKCIFNYKN